MDIKIIIAAHKTYWMPKDDCYLPVFVGAEGKKPLPYTPDNTGDNISLKNSSYCELTGLYWAWKNLKADYVGLAHYRRHFAKRLALSADGKRSAVFAKEDFEYILSQHDVILPLKRNYFIETTRSQYEHAHNPNDLKALEAILASKYPAYVDAFNNVMGRTNGHRFNMFVMRSDVFDRYCSWLFDVLHELESRIDTSAYNSYNSRVFGFIGERLLDVWIEANHVDYAEQRVLFLESQNWAVKIYNFLKRKVCGGVDYCKE